MKNGDSLVQNKSGCRKSGYFTKKFSLFITIFVVSSLSGLLVHGQNNQTSQTVLEGMWMDANGPGFSVLLNKSDELAQLRSMMGELGSARTSYTWMFEGNSCRYLPVVFQGMSPATGEDILNGTFVVDTTNKRFTVTDRFGDKFTFQYIVDTINTSQPGRSLKRLQIKDSNGKISMFYAYLSEEKTSSAPASPPRPGAGTTRDPEFQREYEEARERYDRQMQSLPPMQPPANSGVTTQKEMSPQGSAAQRGRFIPYD